VKIAALEAFIAVAAIKSAWIKVVSYADTPEDDKMTSVT
jgi:hypothetical protein